MNYIAQPKGVLLLGVKIPKAEMNRTEVLDILARYKKRERWVIVIMLLTTATSVFLYNYGILSTIYCLLWTFGGLLLMQILFNKAYDELYAYKKSQGWVVGETCTMSVDTEVARLKQGFSLSQWHWLLIVILTAVGSYLWIPEDKSIIAAYIFIGTNIIIMLTLFILYKIVPKVKSTIYSKDSKVNVALNQCYCHELTKAMVYSAYVNALSWIIGGFIPQPYENLMVILFVTGISTILTCFFIFYALYKVQKERRLIQQIMTDELSVDDDVYWRGGHYNNPNDPKLLVEKRNGIGMEMNGARPAAKVIDFLVTAIVIGCFALLIYYVPLDFPSLSLHIDQGILYVNATQYDQQIQLDDIDRAQIITELPKLYKNNGLESSQYDLGQFRAKEYGQSKVFVNKDYDKYLLIYAGDKIYFINSDKEEEFAQCVTELKNRGLIKE